jgi:tetratricopeptide (TPR) repeat protein
MKMADPALPVSVLTDKERLADYILARAHERLSAAPAAEPPSSPRPRRRLLSLRPTAWSVSMGFHALLLLGVMQWAGVIPMPSRTSLYLVSFSGGFDEQGGDGQEAGGSGSAPVLGPDTPGETEKAAPAEFAVAPLPAPVPLPQPASLAGGEAEAGPAGVPGGSAHPGAGAALGGTLGKGHGGSGGGVFGARAGRGKGLGLGGGTPASEASVDLGLAWLAAHQARSGAWELDAYFKACPSDDACGSWRSQTFSVFNPGATGLALLAFLGAGNTHREGTHREVVSRALDSLRASQTGEGAFGTTFEGMMYNQGLSTLALAELYAMTLDEAVGSAAQRGVDFLERAQQAGGGWDYGPAPTGRNDTSITGWQVMALKSAQSAGLRVSPDVILRAVGHFVRQGKPSGDTVYADREPFTGRMGAGMAAVGLSSRIFLGWPSGAPAVARGAQRCLATPPVWKGWEKDPFQGPYTWYYATLGLYQAGGESWTRWNPVMRDFLVSHQASAGHAAGSWEPDSRFGAVGGRVCATALNVLTLEVYYRYLPLYEQGPAGQAGEEGLLASVFDGLKGPAQLTALGLMAREYDPVSASAFLRRCLEPARPDAVRLEAAARLMALGDPAGLGLLTEAIDRLPPAQQVHLASLLLETGHPKALPCLERALKDPNPVLRFGALKAIEAGAGRQGIPLLIGALEDAEPHVRTRALEALARVTGEKLGQDPAVWQDWHAAVDPRPVPMPKPPQKAWEGMRMADILLALEPATREPSEIREAQAAYQVLREGGQAAVNGAPGPLQALERLNRYLYEEAGFSACAPGAGPEAIYLVDTLKIRKANCVGLSGLTLALAEDLGIPLKVVSTPSHCFLRLELKGLRRNVEPTAEGRDIPDTDYPRLLGDEALDPASLRSGPREAFLAAFLASRGTAKGRGGQWAPALSDLDLALALDPGCVAALASRGNCFKAVGRIPEAERDYARALELSPSWLPALLGQATCLAARGQADQAHALVERAAQDRPHSVQALAALGESQRRRGDLAKALASAGRALALDAEDAPALCLKGRVLYQQGDPAGAERVLAQAVMLSPRDADIRTQLGRVYGGTRSWDAAVAQLREALVCDRGSTEARTLLDYAMEKGGLARP